MLRVYHHFRGRAITIGIAGGWVESRWAGYETYSRSWGMIRLK
ncbi:hypothetical protein Godav_003902 [Gossypium davidsonii]|uniref:Uncharacterized protein n=2 Tax=Gossypium TaxID=3633 RepID=A0A7J8SJF3_GOSDV|nr:hypothetical protein [Gossypium davidsonii]MBA0661787.1 hypothetical protein [Gossypium klotzschianum]